MICHCLYEEEIVGEISTKNSSKSKRWSSILKQRFQYAPSLNDRFLSVEIQAWLNTNRIQARNRNDVDNIAKLVLDVINQSGIIINSVRYGQFNRIDSHLIIDPHRVLFIGIDDSIIFKIPLPANHTPWFRG